MSYHSSAYSAQYSPPSHASSISSASSVSAYNSHYNVAARYEAAKSFDLADDLEYCPALTIDEVRQYYDEVTAKSILYPNTVQHSPPSQSSTPSPPNTYIHPSPPHLHTARLLAEPQNSVFRPPSRGRGTAAIKIIDPNTREERRRYY